MESQAVFQAETQAKIFLLNWVPAVVEVVADVVVVVVVVVVDVVVEVAAVALEETCLPSCSSWRWRSPRPTFPSPCPRAFVARPPARRLSASSSFGDGKPNNTRGK